MPDDRPPPGVVRRARELRSTWLGSQPRTPPEDSDGGEDDGPPGEQDQN